MQQTLMRHESRMEKKFRRKKLIQLAKFKVWLKYRKIIEKLVLEYLKLQLKIVMEIEIEIEIESYFRKGVCYISFRRSRKRRNIVKPSTNTCRV